MDLRPTTILSGLLLTSALHAQQGRDSSNDRAHKGFHFTLGMGPVYGHIHDKASGDIGLDGDGTMEILYKGTGLGVELRMGGALKENLVLSFDLVSRAITSPQVRLGGTDYNTNEDLSIGEVTYGAGITYFLMPANISLGGTLGVGSYVLTTTGDNSTTLRTDYGFSGVARVGKTWWLGRSVNMGVGLSYSYTNAPNNEQGVKETLWGDRFMASLLFMVH